MPGVEFFRCNKCKQEFVISEFTKRFYLHGDAAPQPIEYEWAWCEKCLKPVHSEKLEDPEELEKTEREISALGTEHKELLFKSGWGDQGKLDQLPNKVRWLRERKSKARCLECGSTSIQYLECSLSEDGFSHPNCLGYVEVVAMGVTTIADKAVFYDLEGNRVRSIPNDEHSGRNPQTDIPTSTNRIRIFSLILSFIIVVAMVLYQYWKKKYIR